MIMAIANNAQVEDHCLGQIAVSSSSWSLPSRVECCNAADLHKAHRPLSGWSRYTERKEMLSNCWNWITTFHDSRSRAPSVVLRNATAAQAPPKQQNQVTNLVTEGTTKGDTTTTRSTLSTSPNLIWRWWMTSKSACARGFARRRQAGAIKKQRLYGDVNAMTFRAEISNRYTYAGKILRRLPGCLCFCSRASETKTMQHVSSLIAIKFVINTSEIFDILINFDCKLKTKYLHL